HGTSPCDLATRRREDWLASVSRSHELLASISSSVIIVGFSAGATLALLFASKNPGLIKALVGVCPALNVQDRKISLAAAAHAITRLRSVFVEAAAALEYRRSHPEEPDTNYQSVPVSAMAELKALMGGTRDRLWDIDAPLVIMQS